MPQTPKLRDILGSHHETVLTLIVDGIDKAYRDNKAIHQPTIGHNSSTFGHLVYHSSAFNLVNGFRDAMSDVVIQRPENSLQIRLDRTAFYVCKAGHRPEENPDLFDFDTSAVRKRIAHENHRLATERRLFEINVAGRTVQDEDIDRYMMIAHCGNALDGACKIVIGPVRPAAKASSPFYWWEEIYRKTSGLASTEELVALDRDAWDTKQVKELDLSPRRVRLANASASDVS